MVHCLTLNTVCVCRGMTDLLPFVSISVTLETSRLSAPIVLRLIELRHKSSTLPTLLLLTINPTPIHLPDNEVDSYLFSAERDSLDSCEFHEYPPRAT